MNRMLNRISYVGVTTSTIGFTSTTTTSTTTTTTSTTTTMTTTTKTKAIFTTTSITYRSSFFIKVERLARRGYLFLDRNCIPRITSKRIMDFDSDSFAKGILRLAPSTKYFGYSCILPFEIQTQLTGKPILKLEKLLNFIIIAFENN